MGTPTTTPSMSRRRYIAVGATIGATAVAGCSSAVDFLAGRVLEDVNVLNGAERHLAGSVEVTDPDGSLVLEDRFDLASDDDEDAQATYDDVLTGSGEYTVALELEDEDDRVIEDSVEVADPETEHVMVFFGPVETDDAVVMTVIEELSDLEELDEFDDVDL